MMTTDNNAKKISNAVRFMLIFAFTAVLMLSCGGGKSGGSATEGDTVNMKYSHLLTIVRHGGYTEVKIADPWKEGKTLHTYILVPDTADMPAHMPIGTVVRTPLKHAVVTTSVHCSLIISLGKGSSIGGVCDLEYMNLPWIKRQCAEGEITDCGNSMQPSIEKIINCGADAIIVSPFENSGGYGRIDKWGKPVIEAADYMETSALGRSEWMKFYGLLFGAAAKADSMFLNVDRDYQAWKATAKMAGRGSSVIMDRLTGTVWYMPGGSSTVGQIITDANAGYPFAADKSSGSLALSFETVLDKGSSADVWMLRYDGQKPLTLAMLHNENKSYSMFKAFKSKQVWGCNTLKTTFYEDTPFRPDLLLRDFIIITHPGLSRLGQPRYFEKLR